MKKTRLTSDYFIAEIADKDSLQGKVIAQKRSESWLDKNLFTTWAIFHLLPIIAVAVGVMSTVTAVIGWLDGLPLAVNNILTIVLVLLSILSFITWMYITIYVQFYEYNGIGAWRRFRAFLNVPKIADLYRCDLSFYAIEHIERYDHLTNVYSAISIDETSYGMRMNKQSKTLDFLMAGPEEEVNKFLDLCEQRYGILRKIYGTKQVMKEATGKSNVLVKELEAKIGALRAELDGMTDPVALIEEYNQGVWEKKALDDLAA